MKTNNIIIVAAVVALVLVFLSGAGVRSYYKSAEEKLKEQYKTEIAASNKIIADLQKQNADYVLQIQHDSVMIAKRDAEIARLKKEYAAIGKELAAAKNQIKDFTAGEAVQYFVDYTKTTDSKMLVTEQDTALVITIPTVKIVDNIFAEHKFGQESIVNLNKTVQAQSASLIDYSNSIINYRKLLENKNSEIDELKRIGEKNVSLCNLDKEKYKKQRNKSRWIIVGETVVAGGILYLMSTQ